MTAEVAVVLPGTIRHGASYWGRAYLMMLRWELTNLRLLLPITIMVQAVTGAGFVLGVGLFFDAIPDVAALFVSTGVVVITLITVGLVMGPQLVAQQKIEETYDFLWSLPVPRTTAALAWLTTNLIIATPGMVMALLVAEARYDIVLTVSPSIVPAVLVTATTGTMIGYAIAHAVPNPMTIQLITQLTIFAILGASPINFPRENLPDWLASLHLWLPFHHMAVVIRGGLTDGLVGAVGGSYLVLGVWATMSTVVTAWVLGRRK